MLTSLLIDSAIVLVAGHVEVSANFSVSTYLAANECFNGTKLGLIGVSFLHAYMTSIQYSQEDEVLEVAVHIPENNYHRHSITSVS